MNNMVNEKLQKEKYDSLVQEHEITEFSDLQSIIKIDENIDLRENFIFRGIKRLSYNLVPSSLRRNKDTNELEINKFILKSEFNFLQKQKKLEEYFNDTSDVFLISIDKNNMPSKNIPK